jgi:hypothetical protein
LIVNNLAWPHFKRLTTRFQATPPSFPEQLDQAPHLLIFLRGKARLKSAKPPIDSFHRRPCLFGDCGAGKSISIDIELVTTFSGDKNWSIISTGMLVGMTVVSNRSNRRERLLIIIIVVCHKSRAVGSGWVQALTARSALMPSPEGNSFPADRKHRTGSLAAGDPPSAIRVGELCAVSSHPAATFPEPSNASTIGDASICFHTSSRLWLPPWGIQAIPIHDIYRGTNLLLSIRRRRPGRSSNSHHSSCPVAPDGSRFTITTWRSPT